MEKKFKVYVSDYDYPNLDIEKSVLEPIGAEVIGLHCKTGENLHIQAHDADAIIQQYAKIPRATIEQLPNCKIIARYGIGVDILDVEAAYEHGMIVTNVPDYCLDEVADHAISLSFMLMRSIPFYNNAVRGGSYQWEDWKVPIPRYRGAVYGLVGYGRIAQNLARKLHTFGFEVISYDPYVSEGYMRSTGVRKVTLEELLERADVVNVMTPYTNETHHIIDSKALEKMKNTAYLVCVSRGKCVDNKALYNALVSKTIAGAALDDPEEEPMKTPGWTPDINPLFSIEDCIFTPHTAYVSKESLDECRYVAANNVKKVLLGEKPLDIVKPRK